MLKRLREPFIPAMTIDIPLEDRDRAFLRMLRKVAGGRMQLVTSSHRLSAANCAVAGYVQLLDDGAIVRITGRGQAYLDALARAH